METKVLMKGIENQTTAVWQSLVADLKALYRQSIEDTMTLYQYIFGGLNL